jgi:hypothetical protein
MNAKQARKQQADTPAPVVAAAETDPIAAAKALLAANGLKVVAPKTVKPLPAPEVLAQWNEQKAAEIKATEARQAFAMQHPELGTGRKGPVQRSEEAKAETIRLCYLACKPTAVQMHKVYGKEVYAANNWSQLNVIMPAELFQECLASGMTATQVMEARKRASN